MTAWITLWIAVNCCGEFYLVSTILAPYIREVNDDEPAALLETNPVFYLAINIDPASTVQHVWGGILFT